MPESMQVTKQYMNIFLHEIQYLFDTDNKWRIHEGGSLLFFWSKNRRLKKRSEMNMFSLEGDNS